MFIEPIINMFKIKFTVLETLVDRKLNHGEHINLFINLETVFNRLYLYNTTKNIIADLRNEERIALSSEIINLIGHYRYFFWKMYSVTSTVFIYYGTVKPTYNCSIYNFYDYSNFEKKSNANLSHYETNSYILENLNLVKIIIKYIPDCYYIDVTDIEKSLIPYYIIEHHSHRYDINMVLARDPYDLQLANKRNTYVLYLDKDDSIIIDKKDIMPFYIYENHGNGETFVSSDLLSLVYSFSGVKSRSIKGINRVGSIRAIKFIERMISEGDIANSSLNDIERLTSILNLEYATIVKTNFQIIDLPHQYLQLTDVQKYNIDKSLGANRYDLESLMHLNVEYYNQNPIEINRVFRGVRGK